MWTQLMIQELEQFFSFSNSSHLLRTFFKAIQNSIIYMG